MDHIGVEIKVEEDPQHSGGPLLETDTNHYQKLIQKTDKYLDILSKIPLGRPVPGGISSKYGYRSDPLVKRKAFHSGIDFRGKTGDNIISTADGVVKDLHTTRVGQLYYHFSQQRLRDIIRPFKKILVKRGEKIARGQKIGHIGNTGRSTGSHLHYEIRYNDKTVNPLRYLQVANLSVTIKG